MSQHISAATVAAGGGWLQILQIWLLALVRAVVNMGRTCMGPMLVVMTPELGYTTTDNGQILGAFSAGYMLTQIPGGIFADRFGAKPILTCAVFGMAACLLVLPCAADLGLRYLLWLLWAAGFVCGPVFSALQVMTSKWTFGGLNCYASAVCGAGTTAGSLLALGLTPPLAALLGWRLASAVLGFIAMLVGMLWLAKAQSSPDLASVGSGAPAKAVYSSGTWLYMFRSWAKILSAPPVLAIFFVHASQVAVRMFLVSWMPFYYAKMLKVSGEAAAMYLVIPEILGMVASLFSGSLARHLESAGLSSLASRRLLVLLGTAGMGTGLLTITLKKTAPFATIVLCFIQVFSNIIQTGFNANYLDVCKYSNGLVSGVGNSVATLASYLGAICTATILDGVSEGHAWSLAFRMFAGLSFLALALYMPLASTTPVDEWAGKTE